MRFRPSFSMQMFLAVAAGILLGGAFARAGTSLFCMAGLQLCDFVAGVFVTGAQAVALPLIVASVILGAAGLEPMRNLGRIVGKTLLWIIASSLVAVVVGLGLMFLLASQHPLPSWNHSPSSQWLETFYSGLEWHLFRQTGQPGSVFWAPWLGVTLLSLAIGYYRNQLEEGQARLILRFCLALDGMLTPLIAQARRFLPLGAGALAASWTARQGGALNGLDDNFLPTAGILTVGLLAHGFLILPGTLWLLTRINPWRYLRLFAPALWWTLLNGSPAAALPLTLDVARREAGIPNRVAAPTLTLCAMFARDGLSLIWVLTFNTIIYLNPVELMGNSALGWVIGWGPGAARTWSPYTASVTMELAPNGPVSYWEWRAFIIGAAVWLLCGAIAAISVWSHACAAAVIAHSEGERTLLSPPAPPGEPSDFDDLPDTV